MRARQPSQRGRGRTCAVALVVGLTTLTAGGAAGAVPPPTPAAQAWLLVAHDSGAVLAAQGADQALAPAILTKLMTAYLLFERLGGGALTLTEPVRVSRRAAAMPGSRLALSAGTTASVDDLLKAMLVRSANDATAALVEHVAQDEARFVASMNATAARLGLGATHFANATGLDHPQQRASARDISLLASRLLRDFPELYARYFGLREFTWQQTRHYNRNLLLWRDDSVDGVKTGRTQAAGYCLVAAARRGDMRLIATVLGAPDEDARVLGAQRLLDWGFENYETRLLYRAAQPAARLRVWLGADDTLAVGTAESLYVTLPRGAFERLHAQLALPQQVRAPIRSGEALGTLTLDLDGRRLGQHALVALADMAPGNLWQRALDRVRLLLQ